MTRTPKLALAAMALASIGLVGAACTPAPSTPGPTPTPGCFELAPSTGNPIRHKVWGKQYAIYNDGNCTSAEPTFGPWTLEYTSLFYGSQSNVQTYCDLTYPPGTTHGYDVGNDWIPAQRGWVTCQPLA